MNIIRGTVVSNIDDTRVGNLKAIFTSLGQDIVDVIYTSPFYTLNGGGLLGIPEDGSNILAFKDSDNKIYYLSTVVETPSEPQRGGLVDFKPIGDNRVYSERGKPQKVSYGNQFGSGLDITRKFLPDYIVTKVDLNSEKGKKISLNDSPKSDAVIIRNEHGDGIAVAGDGDDVHAQRSIEIKSIGPQKHVVMQSDYGIMVVDGRDINIENFSTGAYANAEATGKYGNVNLRSENADISLVSNADDGKVFIITPNARIQILDNGTIEISSNSDINIKSDGNIGLEGENINIKANTNLSMEGRVVSTNATGGNNTVAGTTVQLNPTSPPAPVNNIVITGGETDYGE